ncbi:hypothetical protein CGCTS75_v011822 [Colletotrichum tropicale]|nr:hypothetical protein CGCTS75_v011822 [Colletotrichum tropicale]
MTPPCLVFDASDLPRHVQADLRGKKRKVERGADVDLSKCALRAMTQFRCTVKNPDRRDSPIGCWPIMRVFRQCQDKKGTFTVETTAWEVLNAGPKDGHANTLGLRSTDVRQGHGREGNGDQRTYHEWPELWEK